MLRGEHIFLKLGGKMILQDLSITLSPGEFVLLLGPNGAGKSTLLKVLALLLKPSSGSVSWEFAEGRYGALNMKGKIGVLFHGSFLYDRLTAWENLKFYGHIYQVADLPKKIEAIIEEVGLAYYLHEPVANFSRGMVQRLAIARLFLTDPEIILLDEPFTGLDQKGGNILLELLRLKGEEGKTILMVTHDFEWGMDLVSRIMIMRAGRKIFDERATGFSAEQVRRLYLAKIGME